MPRRAPVTSLGLKDAMLSPGRCRGLSITAPSCRGSSVAAGGTRRALMLWRSALRSDCTAVLGPRSRRKTHCAHFVRCVQTPAASQTTKRAARADLEPARIKATQIAPVGYHLPLRQRCGFSSKRKPRVSKGASGQVVARLWCAEKRRARGRARSALRRLTCRRLFERSERSERSELGDRPRDRASQGSRSAAQTAPAKRRGLPGCAFAARTVASESGDVRSSKLR